MITIRADQMTALLQPIRDKFRNDMARHLRVFSPEHSTGIGEENLYRVIDLGMTRASGYGFTNRGPVRLYIELMFLLGSHFDSDPQAPAWIMELLRNGDAADQMIRARLLYGQTLDYLRAVAGPDDAYARRAVAAFRTLVRRPRLVMSEVTMRQDLLALMREVYPERCDYVGDAALDRVIDRGAAVADGLGLDKTRGAALCVLMLFQLGHGCFDDPLFPWVPLAVRSLTGDDPPSRTAQLERKAMTYLDLIARRLAAAH